MGAPAPGKRAATGDARSSALSGAITQARNERTGRHIGTYPAWMQMVNEHERHPGVLFRNRH